VVRVVDRLAAVIVAANTVTLTFGTTITVLAYRASARTGSSALRSLSLGLGLVTLGALLGGGLHLVWGAAFTTCGGVQRAFPAAVCGALAYSVYAERPPLVDLVDRPGGNRRSDN
jgi:hypothetical protein